MVGLLDGVKPTTLVKSIISWIDFKKVEETVGLSISKENNVIVN